MTAVKKQRRNKQSRNKQSHDKYDSINGTTNHCLESEENNNIPEIQSFSTVQKDEMLIDEIVTEIQEEGINGLKEEKGLPMSAKRFLEIYQDKLFDYEIKEL